MVYQVVLDLQDPEVNREKEVLMVDRVTQETQDCLVIKVSVFCSQIGLEQIVDQTSKTDCLRTTTVGKDD